MKKLIFCFDGTCNSPDDSDDFFEDSSISNVLKLHAFLGGKLNPANGENNKTPDQRSFYYSGIGTRGWWLKQKFNAIFAPPYGDMDDIIDKAEEDLHKHYEDGDKIYVFGFSRGAAIARMFSANLDKTVTFLGVFDTVAATKGSLDLNPDSYPASGIVFENGTIGDHIEKAVHLVSIDEKRLAFQPTLFNSDKRVTEVWFAGVHSDIGGGYWFDGLSDITLQYMLDTIKDSLRILTTDEIDFNDLKLKGGQDAICLDDLDIKPLVHGKLHEQKRTGIKAKTLAPRLVRVNIDDHPSKQLPLVHYTVVDRFNQVTEYRPYALRNTKYKILYKDGEKGKERNGIADLGLDENFSISS